MPRYFFVQPDVARPTGGNNVSLNLVDILSKSGLEAATLHGRRDYVYPFHDTSSEKDFYPPLAEIPRRFLGRKRRALEHLRELKKRVTSRKGGINILLKIRPDDVFVIPEFWYPEYSALFPRNKCILLVQGVFAFCRALGRDLESGARSIDGFEAICATSEATRDAVEQFSKHRSCLISQAVSRPSLDAVSPKKRQIAYMPRRRKDEIYILLDCLKGNLVFDGWDFKAIDGVSADDADDIISESLIFLSFSQRDGFGLPPAEAMAAGCIVIGYTGVGGDEFFQPDVGMPILDSDIVSFAATLEATVTEYTRDPTRLDEMRKFASEKIRARYSVEAQRDSLVRAWTYIDEKLSREGENTRNIV